MKFGEKNVEEISRVVRYA